MPRETKQSLRFFSGQFLVFRLGDKELPDRLAGAESMPVTRHQSPSMAIHEAKLLNAHHPESTFVVMKEIARVKQIPTVDQEKAS